MSVDQPPAAQPVGFYRDDDSFGEFTIPCSGAVPEHGWRPVYLQPDPRIAQLEADLAAAQAERDAFSRAIDALNGQALKAEAEAAALRAAYDHICMHIRFDDGLAYMPENEFPRLFTKLDAAIDQARGAAHE